ncbi:uncharacterized protein V1516DRAFT_632829 [Lipomyces oligophaga]|uniref:uncharacterized protein n=1 Tax=Lipomyces oligophaga TaxID=45792 RepID=UPI0034CE5649
MIDQVLLSECDKILNNPAVLEEEQADEISKLISSHYATRDQVLTSSDLEELVLSVLWQHRESVNTNIPSGIRSTSSHSLRTRSSFGTNPINANHSSQILRKKVVRGRFNFPSPTSAPVRVISGSTTFMLGSFGSDAGSIPSTRSASPESPFLHHSHSTASSQQPIPEPSFPNRHLFFDQSGVEDLSTDFRDMDFFPSVHGFYDDVDNENVERLQTYENHDRPVEAHLIDSFQAAYDNSELKAVSSLAAPVSVSVGSSPSTSLSSSFTVANNGGHGGSNNTTPVLTSSSLATISPSSEDMSSPFDHVRSALGLSGPSDMSDTEIINSLDRNGYDIYIALTELMDKLEGKLPDIPQDIKVQTIGPAYSMQSAQSASKEHSKIPTVCRYFLTTGQCLRPDCRFAHDLSATVCRYWLQNSCLAGSTCVFLHSIPPEMLSRLEDRRNGGVSALFDAAVGITPSATSRKNLTLKDESEFPALPVSGSPANFNKKASTSRFNSPSTSSIRNSDPFPGLSEMKGEKKPSAKGRKKLVKSKRIG